MVTLFITLLSKSHDPPSKFGLQMFFLFEGNLAGPGHLLHPPKPLNPKPQNPKTLSLSLSQAFG